MNGVTRQGNVRQQDTPRVKELANENGKWIDEVLQIALPYQPEPLPPEVPTAASILSTPVGKMKPEGEQEIPPSSTH